MLKFNIHRYKLGKSLISLNIVPANKSVLPYNYITLTYILTMLKMNQSTAFSGIPWYHVCNAHTWYNMVNICNGIKLTCAHINNHALCIDVDTAGTGVQNPHCCITGLYYNSIDHAWSMAVTIIPCTPGILFVISVPILLLPCYSLSLLPQHDRYVGSYSPSTQVIQTETARLGSGLVWPWHDSWHPWVQYAFKS